MRFAEHQQRRRRRSRGQALVEFALVIPIFLTIVIAICEFTFLFTSYVSIGFATHDASQLAATLGNTDGADAAILQRIDNDVMVPANPRQITEVDIYKVDTSSNDGSPDGSRINTYKYDGGTHPFTMPDGSSINLPFSQTGFGYPAADRCNVNQGVGCLLGQTTVDTIAVKIVYQYVWITPFPALVSGGSGSGPIMTSINVMRLEPIR